MAPHFSWMIGNGNRAQFWFDVWLLEVPLIDVANQLILEELKKYALNYRIKRNGWDIDKLSIWLNLYILGKLKDFPPPQSESYVNTYCSKSARWRKLGASKVLKGNALLLWLTRHRRDPTSKLFERHISTSSCWPVCDQAKESNLHALRDCLGAKSIWGKLVNPACFVNFLAFENCQNWLDANLLGSWGGDNLQRLWKYVFRETTFVIWFRGMPGKYDRIYITLLD
ncbi:hypothetical protein M9H77_30687 [Catharanthus roseus]|uniref:Uncharacterized protein n=1 Tax=Catharanthus roseus TaxID=4058 RepID=A0ACB9ZXX9_CATRO|nr:hypothetical protein M9H77_30687 [Catharanthus roseus]